MEHRSIRLLNQAIDLAEKERVAIQNEEYAAATTISRERGRLTDEAWKFYDASVRDTYRARLEKLSALHNALTRTVTTAYEDVRASLQQSKRERRRMHGYQMAITQALQ